VHTGRPEESWRAREDASHPVLVALYLRDALGVPDVSGLPRLRGTGLPVVEPPDMRTSWTWMRWWMTVVEDDDPRFPVLAEDDDATGRAVGRHLDSARTWASVVHRAYNEGGPTRQDLTLNDVVHERETELGRAARPFRLRIEVLPLVEPGLWWIGESAIAVDESVRAEPVLYADALRPVIEQLA